MTYIEKYLYGYTSIILAMVGLMIVNAFYRPFGDIVSSLIIIVGSFAVIYLLKRKLSSWMSGYFSEKKIGYILRSLEGFKVIENVVIGNENIDLIVIGTTGIWIVEAKGHTSARVDYDGNQLTNRGKPFEKNFIKQVWRQSYKLKNLLKAHNISAQQINKIIVFSNYYARVRLGKRPIQGIQVIGRSWLIPIISEHKEQVFSPEQVEKLSNEIRALK